MDHVEDFLKLIDSARKAAQDLTVMQFHYITIDIMLSQDVLTAYIMQLLKVSSTKSLYIWK